MYMYINYVILYKLKRVIILRDFREVLPIFELL